jgi:hypothetical protein
MSVRDIKAQGTQLYLLNIDESPDSVMKVGNVVTMPEVGGEGGDIETTDFDQLTTKTFLTGLLDPGTGALMVNIDKEDDSHIKIRDIRGGALYWWAIGWPDGYDIPPTASGGEFVLPDTRTWDIFRASVRSAKLAYGKDGLITMAVNLRLSGDDELVLESAGP